MSLMEKVSNRSNIHLAYLRVLNGSMNTELVIRAEHQYFLNSIPDIYNVIQDIILAKVPFEFSPLEELLKPKFSENSSEITTRPLVRMNFFDSVIIQCFLNILGEQIISLMPSWNYGYKIMDLKNSQYFYQNWRTGYSKYIKTELDAIESKKYLSVIETDIEKFYPSISHDLLLQDLKRYIKFEDSDEFFNWIEKLLNLYLVQNEKNGLPQGPLHSPLLALFFIRDCFQKIREEFPRIICFGYVDDLRIYCEYPKETADEIFSKLSNFFVDRNLNLNVNKTSISQVQKGKENEADLMSKASNLGRAIRDEVILSSDGIIQMRNRLQDLFKDLEDIYTNPSQKAKLKDKLTKFVDYRMTKLIDSNDGWYEQLDRCFSEECLKGNFVANWHLLFLKAETANQKRDYIEKINNVLFKKEYQEYSYVMFLALKYMFQFSPKVLRISDEDINFEFLFPISNLSINETYQKAILSSMHDDWIIHLESIDIFNTETTDVELNILKYTKDLIDTVPERYKYIYAPSRLYQDSVGLSYKKNKVNSNDNNYLKDEDFKNIKYRLFNYSSGIWHVSCTDRLDALQDIKLNETSTRQLLNKIFSWLRIQLMYDDKRIPASVVHPEYVWFDLKNNALYLLGNPAWQTEYLFANSPNILWRKAFIALFEELFNIELERGLNILRKSWTSSQSPMLFHWQYRILKFLFVQWFTLNDFVENVHKVLKEDDSSSIIDYEQFKVDHIMKHYIKDETLEDNLLQISNYVEGSWKNGSKECFFFTLHNHEHARYLIFTLHEIFEKSGFSIFLNKKEAFRLFAACFLHDIGMLSEPNKERLYNDRKKDIQYLQNEINQITQVAVSRNGGVNINLELPQIYEIYNQVEQLREQIVRKEHPYVSEKELVGDYPDLLLTVAERRDVGIVSAAHGWNKLEVQKITDNLHDGKHPIHLKLISLLLRLADLCDVTKDRVRKEVLERNHQRMSETSLFHWIKHLSVENLSIDYQETIQGNTRIILTINHNYIPSGNILSEVLERKCGSNCKKNENNDLPNFMIRGASLGQNSYYNYFEPSNCSLTCAFINESYKWFYAEILFINEYFEEKGIKVEFDLKIILTEDSRADFNFIKNRNNYESAQSFMFNYFQN